MADEEADTTKATTGRVTFAPDMKTATFEETPATPAAPTPAPVLNRSQKWYYPPASEFSGLVQFMANGPGEVEMKWLGRVQRGEVKSPGDGERGAARAVLLVAGGMFSYVAPGTPLGVPDELKPKASKPASEVKP